MSSPPDSRSEVPADATVPTRPGLRGPAAGRLARTVRGHPPKGGDAPGPVSVPAGDGAAAGVASGHAGRAGDAAQYQPGQAPGEVRGELLPVHHDAWGGADEQ